MGEDIGQKRSWLPPFLDRKYVFDEGDNFSIAYVGDMHLHCSNFRSRVDNYPETCIEKLGILRKEMNSRGIKYLFCPGDIFHVPKERTDFEFAVMKEFYKFRDLGIKVFVSTGNHDISQERIENIEKSSLGLLYLSEAVLPFTKVTFRRGNKVPIVVTGLHFPNDVEPIQDLNAYNILACHKFYNIVGEPSIFEKDLDFLGYNMYLMNHDHVPYPLKQVKTSSGMVTIVRPGSFMRATSHSYNTNRMVYMDEIKFNGHVEVIRNTLPVRAPEEIFSANTVDRVEDNSLMNISRQMVELVTKMYEIDESGLSIYTILDQTSIDVKVKERIVMYLESFGIFRKRVSENI